MSDQTLLPFMEKTTPKVRNKKPYRERNKEKVKLREKAYRERNKERIKLTEKAYKDRNKEKTKIYNKNYRKQNTEKCKALYKAYRERNKEKLKLRDKVYRENNKEKLKLTNKAYRENNKEKLKVASEAYQKISNVKYWNRNLFKCFKSKNNKLNTKIDFDADYLLELFEKQNGMCPYFKIPLIPSPDKSPFQPSVDRKDNYIGYTKDNIVLCSYMANMSRNDIPYDKWMEYLNKLQINYITDQTNYSEQ